MDTSTPPDDGRAAPLTGGPDDPAAPDEHDGSIEPASPGAPAAVLDHDPADPDAPADPDSGEGGPDPLADGDGGPDDPVVPAAPVPLVPIDDPANPGHGLANLVSWVIVAITCIAVAWSLHPEWILNTNTPTGGDMGAHVWGPAYLRDHLLPNFQLTGWSPDWYAGFPAYVFYMVIPSLAIVLLNVGPPVWLSPFLLAALGVAAWFVERRVRSLVWRIVLWSIIGVAAVLSVPIPYEVAFKIVTVAGLIAMPLAGYALGRAARLPFPGPPLIAIGAAAFLYETGFTILGGNIASTMAGEFAFSISLALAVLYVAVLFSGMRTGRMKALGALLFGLVVLCHIIPAMFAVGATVIAVLTRREDRDPWWDSSALGRWLASAIVAATLLTLWLVPDWFPIVATVAAVVLFVSFDSRAFRFAVIALPIGGLLTAFWTVPFYVNSPFMNDMGWEKYTQYAKYLWPQAPDFDMPYRNVVFALAGLGVILSLVHRARLGWYLSLMVVALGWAFRFAPQWRLWNARILPFYYLCLYLLAAVAVVLVIRSLALVVGDLRRRSFEPAWVSVAGAAVVAVVVLVAIGGALRVLPGGKLSTDTATGVTRYEWLGIDFGAKQNVSSGWASYNYQGLESRPAYPEFRAVVSMMDDVGREHGCGRAMWEYEPKLDRFGTPMALMLLPYFTDGCIGSMEGLYFEASSTTPFHFLNQSELSVSPSRAQRDLPYGNFDLDLGIQHLQLLGVKYYVATSQQAIDAARQDDRLTEVATTGPWNSDGTDHTWVAFEIADADLVVPLENEPVVLKDTDDHIDGWVYGHERAAPAEGQTIGNKSAGPATSWYLDPARWSVPLATSGPEEWARVAPDDRNPPKTAVPEVKVSDVETTDESISFTVDKVGTPVLVKASYFPNWQASGADGPYRVSPNQMVVIPTEKNVTLTYGTTWVDRGGWVLTIVGVVLLLMVAVHEERSRRREDELVVASVPTGDGGDGPDGDGPDDGLSDDDAPDEPPGTPVT